MASTTTIQLWADGPALVPVKGRSGDILRDDDGHEVSPVQEGPAFPGDVPPSGVGVASSAEAPSLAWVRVEGKVGSRLHLSADSSSDSGGASPFEIETTAADIRIHHGGMHLRLPAEGSYADTIPGPLADWWTDASPAVADTPPGTPPQEGGPRLHLSAAETKEGGPVELSFTLESQGPAFLQWRLTYEFASGGSWRARFRWIAGTDTLLVCDEVTPAPGATLPADRIAPLAHLLWSPWGPGGAQALGGGGGEGRGPMRPLGLRPSDKRFDTPGQRPMGQLGHVAYFGQWNLPWVGLVPADEEGSPSPAMPGLGVFTGWGGAWTQRGRQRITLREDGEGRACLRLPIAPGQRRWAMVLADKTSLIGSDQERCLLNLRKAALADLRPDKTTHWQVDAIPPAPGDDPARVLPEEDLPSLRQRLAADRETDAALTAVLAQAHEHHDARLAAAIYKEDEGEIAAAKERLFAYTDDLGATLADGGYERLIIFQARILKRYALDVAALRSTPWWSEEEEARFLRSYLLATYAYDDPDFCVYDDFWVADHDPDGVLAAMQDEVGDCPVPPNFVSEFFSLVALAAELAPGHPRAPEWRRVGLVRLERFLQRWFAPTGGYLESVNYHTHAFNELLCQIIPLVLRGQEELLGWDRIRAQFDHFLGLLLPPMADHLPEDTTSSIHLPAWYARPEPPRAVYPADGNSGSHGLEQEVRGEFIVGAWLYRDRDPALARSLTMAWLRTGKAVLDLDHPTLTLFTLPAVLDLAGRIAQEDDNRPDRPDTPEKASAHLPTLGLVSRGRDEAGEETWSYLRAGRATHHMDFDQGHVRLVRKGRVLLGDYGYHAKNSDGKHIACWQTRLHNTVLYGGNPALTSGYTGLEVAPEPRRVFLGADFDWIVHEIVNTQYRDASRFGYAEQIPAPTTVHLRHAFFRKGEYAILWDVFPAIDAPPELLFHPNEPVRPSPLPPAQDARRFRAGQDNDLHLDLEVLLPRKAEPSRNLMEGAFADVAFPGSGAEGFLTLLAPGDQGSDWIVDRWEWTHPGPAAATGPTLRLRREGKEGTTETVTLPPPGSVALLPRLEG